ncbi:sodium-coupled monocarboxylate transporter 1-like isoform X2 [Bacillus rossius redtenbacheri]|uniref:sodium-coupled monocarboxylate transporter 1-like isoform X2 n=1 Tax=Bacillus rossius redtenbacheri TaxID=93214 RepID=UPI002FDEC064
MTNSTGTPSPYFGWADYSAFGLMVALSTVVGGLIGVCGKQDTKADYLLGGRSMKVFPIAVSLVFSQLSGIALIGVPTEVYTHGTQYYAISFSLVIASLINNYLFLPVFFDLKLTSTYEYLELRFNQKIRFLMSLLFDISIFLYIPIVLYVPALTFNHVSGIDVHLVTYIVSITCIFYTMLGGLKAVVWTDFLQSFVTVGSSLIVIAIGVAHVGGIGEVFSRSYEGQRLELFNLDPSPLARNTFWTVTLGMTFAWLSSMAASQGMVQKVIALPDITSARKSIWWFCVGNIFMKSVMVMVGLTIYSTYYECDPIKSKKVNKPDNVVPYFVMDTAGSIPGLPGFFIAGIFSAALSTMSSDLNCLSATLYEDVLLPCAGKKRDLEERAHVILKTIVVVFGLLCTLMVYVVENLGTIFDLSMSVSGITTGAFLGVYCLGMMCPWANAKFCQGTSVRHRAASRKATSRVCPGCAGRDDRQHRPHELDSARCGESRGRGFAHVPAAAAVHAGVRRPQRDRARLLRGERGGRIGRAGGGAGGQLGHGPYRPARCGPAPGGALHAGVHRPCGAPSRGGAALPQPLHLLAPPSTVPWVLVVPFTRGFTGPVACPHEQEQLSHSLSTC